MGTVLAILILVVFVVFAVGIVPFSDSFKSKFKRSFIHWENIAAVVVFGLSIVLMYGSGFWTAMAYISGIALIILVVVQVKKYGVGWGLGVWAYNVLAIAMVISVINAISNALNRIKK